MCWKKFVLNRPWLFAPRFAGGIPAAAAALALALGGAALTSSAQAAGGGGEKKAEKAAPKRGQQLRARGVEYISLSPFSIPVVRNDQVVRQFMVIVVLELEKEEDRSKVQNMIPRIRNEYYRTLYQLLSFNRELYNAPPMEALKLRLEKVATGVLGEGNIKNVLIQAILERRLR